VFLNLSTILNQYSLPLVAIFLSFLFETAIAEPLPDLPEPVSNNAVAHVTAEDGEYLLSFMGLGSGKTYLDVHNKVWALKLPDADSEPLSWQAKSPVPSSLPLKGRLASIAVGIKNKAYIFGGYTVDRAHNEISSPDSYAYDVFHDRYNLLAPMPVPVDDAVALVYRQRYIYLISGWHNDGNVNLVQVYDIHTNSWHQASPFLGVSVFGHAAGIVDNNMLICDGVKVQAQVSKRRTFIAESACYSGTISDKGPFKIDWRKVAHPTGTARYRMAVGSDAKTKRIWFFGGSENPYNYNGIGYDGKPSEPSNQLWKFDWHSQTWQLKTLPLATMDHRGAITLLISDSAGQNKEPQIVVIGGIGRKQKSLGQVSSFSPYILPVNHHQ
jgi:N-acetylneuraminic acid mutarotase